MSAVNALDRLQAYANAHPSFELERSASVLRAGPVAASAFDYDQAIAIMQRYPAILSIADGSRQGRLREIVASLILHLSPSWKWVIPMGRGYLATHLNADTRQLLDAAGLYGPSNDQSVRTWWDKLAQMVRGASAEVRTDTGRRGEDLTLEHERNLLVASGRGDLYPEAVAFEDNTLGYDVRSFSVSGAEVRPKYIEVKATENQPLRFYLSRSEWRAASRFRDDFFVQLWYLPSEQVIEIDFAALSAHVPIDRGSGVWDTVIIDWA